MGFQLLIYEMYAGHPTDFYIPDARKNTAQW